MDTFKINTRVKSNHEISVGNIPFEEGQEVEVTISKKNGSESFENLKEELKGSVVKYKEPFESAIDTDEWELL
jgi:hypothetical protein